MYASRASAPSRFQRLRASQPLKPSSISRNRRLAVLARQSGGLGDEDLDMAVFRFTLGIPGFDDRLVPRVVGLAGGALLAVNYVLSAQPVPPAQGRAEALVAVVAALCIVVPEIEERLRETMPGRGRQKTADNVAGATSTFAISSSLPDQLKQELAWASFVLLRNTNICALVAHDGRSAVLARGALGTSVVTPQQAEQTLAKVGQDLAASSSSAVRSAAVVGPSASGVWLPDAAAMSAAGLSSLATVPSGAQCAVLQPIPGAAGAFLLLFSERPRALSGRERGWVEAIAAKLGAQMSRAAPTTAAGNKAAQ